MNPDIQSDSDRRLRQYEALLDAAAALGGHADLSALFGNLAGRLTLLSGKKVLTANHRIGRGAPEGGNFAFEDGHVEWVGGHKVGLGASFGSGSWMCYFKYPAIVQ